MASLIRRGVNKRSNNQLLKGGTLYEKRSEVAQNEVCTSSLSCARRGPVVWVETSARFYCLLSMEALLWASDLKILRRGISVFEQEVFRRKCSKKMERGGGRQGRQLLNVSRNSHPIRKPPVVLTV
ncbi:hypothetical protein CEXT_732911 [Caerostris extrusa]|uniref:Uncharacterized protein n=1 Tax=Caerostris extrusa TaxID=172846 RepID=A0AAV4QZD9_CAEEX|nr:hypothetical protein CEXT_732911 [Caerostris extrusa]